MRKIMLALMALVMLTGCSNAEIKKLEAIVENVDYSSLSNNEEVNNLYNSVENIEGETDSFKEKKKEIEDKLKDQAIEIWENELIKAIEKKQWKDYFDFKESIAFRDYYYWFSNERYSYNQEDLDNYVIENKFLTRNRSLEHFNNDEGYFLGADKKYEEIYVLTQYLNLFLSSDNVNNPPYTDFEIDLWKFDLSKINPDYNGKMADQIHEFAVEIFGSEEEWRKHYKAPTKYWTGNVQHYFFASQEELDKYNINVWGEEKVASCKQEEIDDAERSYQRYISNKENNGYADNDNTATSPQTAGFKLENSKIVTDKDKLAKCWTVATKEVKKNLKAPSSAKFPFSAISDGVEILQDRNYYCVHGWVEAENSFGAKIKNDFVVLIEEKNGSMIPYDCAIK